MKSKGYILAELLLYIAISMVVLVLTFNILVYVLRQFAREKTDEIAYNNMISFVNYLDNVIDEPNDKSYKVENNKFSISLNTSDHEDKIISFSSGEIKLLRVGYVMNGVNKIPVLKESRTLLGDVKSLSFYKKNNLLYLDIKSGEEEMKKCLALKK